MVVLSYDFDLRGAANANMNTSLCFPNLLQVDRAAEL